MGEREGVCAAKDANPELPTTIRRKSMRISIFKDREFLIIILLILGANFDVKDHFSDEAAIDRKQSHL